MVTPKKTNQLLETIEYSYLKEISVSFSIGNYKIKYMHNADKTVSLKSSH
jgi:hypothetical protein